jgi:hypothetical protein
VADRIEDEHQGGDVVCEQCFVTGGGQITVEGQTVQFQLSPQNIQFMVVPASGEGFTIRGDVEGTRGCARENGVLSATVFGTLETGQAFTIAVIDGGEPEADSLTFTANGLSFAADVEEGNIQVHDLDRCEPPGQCGDGTCWCEEKHACEPCPPPPPPRCDHGMCWCEESQVCEPCDGPPHDHLPPPNGPGGGPIPPPGGPIDPAPDGGIDPAPEGGTGTPPGGGTSTPPPGPFIPL